MKILGLDSSGLVASVAIVENDELVAEYTTNYKKTHSQTLLPMLDELRRMIELDLQTIDAIAIASGPGSFTGLRIGSATAKGLGLALDKPLVEVPTLEGMAWNLYGSDRIVCPLMDARRNQVYTAAYEFLPDGGGFRLNTVIPQGPVDIHEILEKLAGLNRPVIFLGDGVPVYRGEIDKQQGLQYAFAAPGNNRQRAASVAALGAVYFAKGQTVSAGEHRPEYLRRTQAEQEAERSGARREGTGG
ncbi:MAG: tRNA (adenosine(37)-N6)-threonylcarbamoyltransferase complex dimerization subunit type 1 TsaB [Lachnospiraceae bacterium]|nr:tRNA (adenosine(37)-N6)-threonylcarbamoyltransferase complex dimerization subunit type 1 TsaB [Lachnospiraceae bacterium]